MTASSVGVQVPASDSGMHAPTDPLRVRHEPPPCRGVAVALYYRKSKPPRGWRPAFPGQLPPGSMEEQQRRLRAWADKEGHRVVLEEHDVASGRDPNRPGWKRIMAAVRGGHVRRVGITRLDRCMRSLRHFLDVAEQIENRGCELEVLDQPAASIRVGEDAMTKAFRNQLGVFAELELDLARERSASVMTVGDDGRTYGPRSDRPAGRPSEYGPEHKFRVRDGRRVHDKARCRACRGEKGGPTRQGDEPRENGGVAEPDGLTTPLQYASGTGADQKTGADARRPGGDEKEAR